MFNKINIKYLTIVFVVLLVLVLLTVPSGNRKKNRSFKSELTAFDTAQVTGMVIYPKSGGEWITFSKKENKWLVSGKEGEYNADRSQVENMLFALSNLRAKRLAARDKDSWKKYELTDSLGTRVEVLGNKKVLADVYVGKFSYSQPVRPANPYQQQQGVMTTFVRLSDEKEVYAVDGFLSMSFNRRLEDFRDSRVVQVRKEQLEQIVFSRPDRNFSLTKNDHAWMIDGLAADSTKVADYLSGLNYVRSSHFIPNDQKPVGAPNYTLKLTGGNGAELATVSAFYTDSTHITVTGSMNAGTYFDGKADDLFTKLFKEKEDFFE